ncbi:hypothetical protein SPHINGO8BC_51495 [Sphingobacterium multivorum]|uniref:Uncharacterized protein n=1 Tax=Sphingobacterium multivorum TaxID=28454 RepID=A0A654D1R6_SPHMU|nr:hypothetical protein SPHINGO8BC_51495 [Sphingobacterium multivorum]
MLHETDFRNKPSLVKGDFVNSIWCDIRLLFRGNSLHLIAGISSSS